MEVIREVKKMQAFSDDIRKEGKRIGFVPTMGYLHEGHLTLMDKAKELSDVLVISIFVNPIQFGPQEDLKQYPRDFERDKKLAYERGVDVIFYPKEEEMYDKDFQTYVEVQKVTKNLCGLSRPGHFRGVATVVAKLFNIVKPHIAVFGKKDYQQLVTIKRMVKDLNFDIEIVGVDTVREEDGLAMSSRNEYLNEKERKAALCLYSSIKEVKRLYERGERTSKVLIKRAKEIIEAEPLAKIDYVKICDPETIEDIDKIEDKGLFALAVKIGKARLIDNTVLGEEKG